MLLPLFLALLLASTSACDNPALDRDRPLLELEGDEIRLESGTKLHEVVLGGAETGDIQTDTIVAQTGDVVRFIAADAHTHAVVFDRGALKPEGRAFLERTEQLRGPPLIGTGGAWVVSLNGAPAGAYRFTCLTHQDRGVLIVQPAR